MEMETEKAEMKNFISICNKIDSLLQKQMRQIEIASFNSTVKDLIERIAQLYNIDQNSFALVCFGKPLDPIKTLDFYGIENGSVIYLFKRKISMLPPSLPPPSSNKKESKGENSSSSEKLFPFSFERQEMFIAIKSALLCPAFYQIIENLTEFDNRENLMAIYPQLRNDPTLFGILTDSELLNAYMSKNNLKSVLNRFPDFFEIATQISASFHKEVNSNTPGTLVCTGPGINYSIDPISEDEENDESDAESISSTNTNASAPRLSDPNMSFTSILMQAYQNQNRQSPSSSSSSSNGIPNSGIITPDMLRQALQSTSSAQPDHSPSCEIRRGSALTGALQAPPPAPQPPPPRVPDTRTPAQILIGWAPQLRQMQEVGITDSVVAIQALEATNGDVQAALNIIFSDIN